MFLGLAVIFVGLVLLLERLGIIEGGFSTYWPTSSYSLGSDDGSELVEEAGVERRSSSLK